MNTATNAADHRWRRPALVALLIAEAMNLLDTTIVTVAAPVIHAGLGGAASDIPWFNAAYTLAFAVLLVPGGRLGDLAGRRRVFGIGVAAFALASTVCALAPTAAVLIGARAVQGAAAALVVPQTFGLIRAMFDGPALGRALGSIGPVMGLAAIAGPVLGSVLTHADLFGCTWRAVFLVNLPLAAVVLALTPLLPPRRAAEPGRSGRLDLPGTALVVLGTALVVRPLVDGGGHRPPWSPYALASGCLVLVLFAVHQRRRARAGRSPLVEPSLFHGRGFPAALVTSALFFAAQTGLMTVVVLELQLRLDLGVLACGLCLLPWSATMALASWAAGGRLARRSGPRTVYAGVVLMLAGVAAALASLPALRPGALPWPLLVALVAVGTGNGLFTTAFFTAALSRVRAHETGSAAGLLNAVQQLGATLGTALLGTAFLSATASGLYAARPALWSAAALLGAAALTASRMFPPRPAPQDQARRSELAELGRR